MKSIIDQFKTHTGLFKNASAGFTNEDAARIHGLANPPLWLAGHIISSRYWIANTAGWAVKEPHPGLFGRGYLKDKTYPSMDEILKPWDEISAHMIEALEKLTPEQWAAQPPMQLPMYDGTVHGFMNFMAHHEAYTIGQLALLRRLSGMDAMKY